MPALVLAGLNGWLKQGPQKTLVKCSSDAH